MLEETKAARSSQNRLQAEVGAGLNYHLQPNKAMRSSGAVRQSQVEVKGLSIIGSFVRVRTHLNRGRPSTGGGLSYSRGRQGTGRILNMSPI